MNPCPACAKAELCPTTGLMQAGCPSCEARAIARMPHMTDVILADAIVPALRDALQAVFGSEWYEKRELAKYWAAKLEAGK